MLTMADVIRLAVKKEDPNIEVDDNIRDRYINYFEEIGEIFFIDKQLCRLKKGRNYSFTQEGAESLAELLHQYWQSKTGRNRERSTKKLEKQIFQNEQYNALLPQNMLDEFSEMIRANKLIVLTFECMFKLFKDAGVSDDQIIEMLRDADRKYSYSKRANFQEIFELMENYIQELVRINEQRHELVTPTERENAIWLEFASKEIRETMEYTLKVREAMKNIIHIETGLATFNAFLRQSDADISVAQISEEKLLNKCLEDDEVNQLLRDYKEITNEKLDFESLVAGIAVNDEKGINKYLKQLLIREISHVPSDGDVKCKRKQTEEIGKILNSLADKVKNMKINYQWPLVYEEKVKYRTKDKELLEKAVENCKKVSMQ